MNDMVEKAPVKRRWLTGAAYIPPGGLDKSLAVKKAVEAMLALERCSGQRPGSVSQPTNSKGD